MIIGGKVAEVFGLIVFGVILTKFSHFPAVFMITCDEEKCWMISFSLLMVPQDLHSSSTLFFS